MFHACPKKSLCPILEPLEGTYCTGGVSTTGRYAVPYGTHTYVQSFFVCPGNGRRLNKVATKTPREATPEVGRGSFFVAPPLSSFTFNTYILHHTKYCIYLLSMMTKGERSSACMSYSMVLHRVVQDNSSRRRCKLVCFANTMYSHRAKNWRGWANSR